MLFPSTKSSTTLDSITARIVIVGGAGNVGRAICQEFNRRSRWNVIGVDPLLQEVSAPTPGVMSFYEQINSTIEDVDDDKFWSWLVVDEKQKDTYVEFIVTNDDG